MGIYSSQLGNCSLGKLSLGTVASADGTVHEGSFIVAGVTSIVVRGNLESSNPFSVDGVETISVKGNLILSLGFTVDGKTHWLVSSVHIISGAFWQPEPSPLPEWPGWTGRLTADALAGDLSIEADRLTNSFQQPFPFYILIGNEILQVTDGTTDGGAASVTWTVERGLLGSSDGYHGAGSLVSEAVDVLECVYIGGVGRVTLVDNQTNLITSIERMPTDVIASVAVGSTVALGAIKLNECAIGWNDAVICEREVETSTYTY